MGLICNPTKSCNNNRCPSNNVEKPICVNALLDYVLDSCCTTEDVCREIIVDCPCIFDPCKLEVGSMLDVEISGPITFKEVDRHKDDCNCLSTVLFTIPVRIYGTEGDGCGCKYIERDICVIRSANLCCSNDSEIETYNSKALNISAVVTSIECNVITIELCILFRSCLQQIIKRQFKWMATPVCVSEDCNDTRRNLVDNCDLVCCEEAKICPTC